MESKTEFWNGYKIIRIESAHIDSLIEISVSAFKIRPSGSYYIDKNSTDNWGPSFIGYIAFDEASNEPAGFYGVYSCEVELDGVKSLVVQSGDTMTHVNHSGKGLFTKLALKTYELSRSLGVKFVFGFPNYNSYPGFVKKLGWVCPGNLNEFRMHTFTFPLVKIQKKFPVTKSLIGVWQSLVNLAYRSKSDLFKNSVLEPGVGGVVRTSEFLKYKIKVGGSYVVKIGESRVWLKTDGFLFIGDIELVDKLDLRKFIVKLKRYAFWIGADVVLFQTTPDSRLDRMFKEIMSPKEAFPFGYCAFDDSIDPARFKFNMCDIDTF